jgi:hypothetical protein
MTFVYAPSIKFRSSMMGKAMLEKKREKRMLIDKHDIIIIARHEPFVFQHFDGQHFKLS